MIILFLAGGEGKRMWPVKTDKSLIPFLGKPLAWHNLKKINQAVNPEKFIIVTNSQNQETFSHLALELGLKAKIAVQKEPKGMADAILSAEHFLNGECLIVNAEDWLEERVYQAVFEAAKEKDVVFAAKKVDEYFPGGYVKISNIKDQRSKIEGVIEKPGEGKEPSDLVKLVVDYFKDIQVLTSYLKKTQSDKDDVYEASLNKMIEDGLEVECISYDGDWQALKYPWHVLDIMERFLKDQRSTLRIRSGREIKDQRENALIAASAVVDESVVLEDGVRVFEGAVIKAPCWIGKNTIIGANALVRDSMIGPNCVIGYSTEVARSYIGPDSWFHTNYVGDSVLEGDFGAGSGAVLANLRLDNKTVKVGDPSTGSTSSLQASSGLGRIETGREKLGLIAGTGVRLGVNASTMPGVRVGANSLIGPGVILNKDLREDTKVTQKADYGYGRNESVTTYNQFRDKLK